MSAVLPRLEDAAIARMRAALLAFFDASARELPWRATRDPYAVWISEVMLQQTRVEAVVPHYTRWLERYPRLDALAAAPFDDVLKQWEGLGYYTRARNLHAAARIVCEQHRGAFPDSYDALRALPGVGDYTAGAVASIVFGAREPAVDGNARRVLCRVLDAAALSPAQLRSVAAALVPAERPGDFNQALMELGARICVPRTPRCGSCPIRDDCRAYAAGTQLKRPRTRRAAALPTVDIVTLVVADADQRVLLVRRGERGLLALMWNFPGIEAGGDAASAAGALLRRLTQRRSRTFRELGTVEHTFSHRRERYRCVLVRVRKRPLVRVEHAWVGADTSAHALPRAQQRIHAMAMAALRMA